MATLVGGAEGVELKIAMVSVRKLKSLVIRKW